MLNSLLSRFISPKTDELAGAHIMLYCHSLFQDDYYDTAKKIEESGLRGTMKVLENEGVDFVLEGKKTVIEQLLTGIQTGALFKTVNRQGCTWLPYRNSFQTLTIQPYLYRATKIRTSGDF